MDNRILSLSLSTVAISLRVIADTLTMIAGELKPAPEKFEVWDRESHSLKPVTLVKGHDPIEKGPTRD